MQWLAMVRFILIPIIQRAAIITIKAFRDSSYPFEKGHWSIYEHPKLATLEKIQVPQFATIGKPLKILINVSENGKPTSDALVNYFISDWRGQVILSGRAEPQSARTARRSKLRII